MNLIKSILCLMSLSVFSQAQASVQSHFDQIKNNPNALYEFFKVMPKGGELHYHLAGGSSPETMLGLASKGDYCLNTETYALSHTKLCSGVLVKELLNQPELYANTIRSWSMKDFVPSAVSGHDHFFNSFLKFMPIVVDHSPELVADVVRRAANQQEQYMELMILPDNANSLAFGALLKKTPSFAEKRQLLLANTEFQTNISHTAEETEQLFKKAREKLGCSVNPQAANCQVSVNFLYYSLREQEPDNLFAQTLNAFEAVTQSQAKGGHLIGVNLVQPEDGIISLRDYRKQMQMYQYLHQIYPNVNIALHAGEITQENVVPEELNYHIHDALMTGQAQRIGHGVAIAYENDAKGTLDYMASHNKAVEINLISNLKILNISGRAHPLNYYLDHHVPVVLSTDDEGILRTDLTSQYVEAVLGHGLDYPKLKQINRNALTYAFLPGKSIWAAAAAAKPIPECHDLKAPSCLNFIKMNRKAQLQWNLEQKLTDFERKY
ncbi:MAG: adenosine deaminase [Legionella sp.]|nr:adenosine deaminase [Legionella sp.]